MPRPLIMWHVWCWDGKRFELVYHDLVRLEAERAVTWNNRRLEEVESLKRYVMARDGESPVLEAQ